MSSFGDTQALWGKVDSFSDLMLYFEIPWLFLKCAQEMDHFFFVSSLKLNGSYQKGTNGRKMCQSFTAERCLTKKALKT